MLFPVPDADNPRIVVDGALLNPTYFIVLGKTDAPGWIFVSFLNSGRNPERIQGWIRTDGLEEIVSWEDVPVLTADDPIAQLRINSVRLSAVIITHDANNISSPKKVNILLSLSSPKITFSVLGYP